MNRMEVQIIDDKDESRELRGMNKEIESHEEVADIHSTEIKQRQNLNEEEMVHEDIYSVGEANDEAEAPEKERNDAGLKVESEAAVPPEARTQIEK